MCDDCYGCDSQSDCTNGQQQCQQQNGCGQNKGNCGNHCGR